jgi:glyoxylase-like metal-dependent hydrolase (beta-lactamase superfamily II)
VSGTSNGTVFERRRVGAFTVTTVGDGFLDIDANLLPKAKPDEITPLLETAGLPQNPIRASINTFVVDLSGVRVLIDAGLGQGVAETAGCLQENLSAAGVSPETIDVILLTHLHRDHVRGITRNDGSALFPNAQVMLHEADHAFWTDEGEENRAPTFARQYFPIARAALEPYSSRTSMFSVSGEVLPGIEAVHLPGHTPGHTMYRIMSGGESLLVAADIVHVPALQFPRPDWSVVLDVDPEQAARARSRVLDAAAADGELVTGMHFTHGRAGRFSRKGRGYFFKYDIPVS